MSTRPKRVFIGIKYCADGALSGKIRMIKRAVTALGHVPYVLEEDNVASLTPKALMDRDFREIDTSDVIILEVTEPSLGVGIEASYARRTKPVIAIAGTGAAVSASIKGVATAFFEYADEADLAAKLSMHLAPLR